MQPFFTFAFHGCSLVPSASSFFDLQLLLFFLLQVISYKLLAHGMSICPTNKIDFYPYFGKYSATLQLARCLPKKPQLSHLKRPPLRQRFLMLRLLLQLDVRLLAVALLCRVLPRDVRWLLQSFHRSQITGAGSALVVPRGPVVLVLLRRPNRRSLAVVPRTASLLCPSRLMHNGGGGANGGAAQHPAAAGMSGVGARALGESGRLIVEGLFAKHLGSGRWRMAQKVDHETVAPISVSLCNCAHAVPRSVEKDCLKLWPMIGAVALSFNTRWEPCLLGCHGDQVERFCTSIFSDRCRWWRERSKRGSKRENHQ